MQVITTEHSHDVKLLSLRTDVRSGSWKLWLHWRRDWVY